MKQNNLGWFIFVICVVCWSLYEIYPPTSGSLIQAFAHRAINRDEAFTNILADAAALQKDGVNRTSWSHDGEWVYFASNRSGRFEVWKTRIGGGSEMQVTSNGGYMAIESADGKDLYYTKTDGASALWRRPVAGGKSESSWIPFTGGTSRLRSATSGSCSAPAITSRCDRWDSIPRPRPRCRRSAASYSSVSPCLPTSAGRSTRRRTLWAAT